ncbi:MAG: adenylate/guanylate cyclase domain-containing protein [Acidobacteria bacterium]|nr:adenylate/guanylate cyclase domain-containing protein [Acidobacteriota bacterium]
MSSIVLQDSQVSRKHAMVQYAPDGRVYLTDLGSRNGTWLNQRRVTSPVALSTGDRVCVGGTELRFHGPARGHSIHTAPQGATMVGFSQGLITVLVIDIRDFTGLSTRLPEARLSELISLFMRESGVVLAEHYAWGQKFIGDAVMAVWLHASGNLRLDELLPVFRSLERIVAIASGLHVTLGLEAPVLVGAGINSGMASIGNMGSDASADYTALSDAVNLAFRLESATKEIPEDVALGATIYDYLERHAEAGSLFSHYQMRLKGYPDPKPVHGINQSSMHELLARMEVGLSQADPPTVRLSLSREVRS